MVTYKSRADGHQDVLLEGKKVGVIKFFANGVRYRCLMLRTRQEAGKHRAI